jgi:undecaprenyl-diphosphatase
VGVGLITFGALLYAADRVGAKQRERDQLTLRDALLIGGAQGLAALFPGTSRSGITITAALLLGYQREAAATVSFLLATPITAAAVGWAGLRMLRDPTATVEPTALAVGIVTSGLAGFLAIHYLLRYVRTRSYTPFVVYRVVVGVSILVLALTRG